MQECLHSTVITEVPMPTTASVRAQLVRTLMLTFGNFCCPKIQRDVSLRRTLSDLVSKKFNSFGISLFLYHKHINSNFELVVKWRKFGIMGDSMKILSFFRKNKTIQTDGFADAYYVISFKNCSYNFFLVVSVYRKSQEFRILVCSL